MRLLRSVSPPLILLILSLQKAIIRRANAGFFDQIAINDIWAPKYDYKMVISLSPYAINDR